MAAVDAWFLGGPIDGKVMAVETSASRELPEVVRAPETAGVYIGASDSPAPTVEHLYVRAEDLADWATYQYHSAAHEREAK